MCMKAQKDDFRPRIQWDERKVRFAPDPPGPAAVLFMPRPGNRMGKGGLTADFAPE